MFSQHFWLLQALRQFTLSSVVPRLSDVLRRSRHAHSVSSFGGKVALLLRSLCAQKYEILSLKNSITVHSWRTRSAIFPIWARYECNMSAVWAQYKHLKCAHQFLGCLSATWAKLDRDVIATWARCKRKNCLALFFHFAYIAIKWPWNFWVLYL